MQNNKKVWIALVVVVIIAIGGYFKKPQVQQVTVKEGAAAGPTLTEYQDWLGGGESGNTNSTSTNSTAGGTSVALVAGDFAKYDTILYSPTQATTTLTFPASSTLTYWLPRPGMRQTQCWIDATTTRGAGLTFVAGTGIDLENATTSTTGAGAPNLLTINGGDIGCFQWVRGNGTGGGPADFHAALTIYRDAD